MRFLLITAVFLQSAAAAAPALAMNSTKFIRTAAGDPQDSVDTLRMKAERGDPEAEYKLGLAYDVGVGTPQDLGQAAAWYERAAEQGHAGAQFSLGLMYGKRAWRSAGPRSGSCVAQPRCRCLAAWSAQRA